MQTGLPALVTVLLVSVPLGVPAGGQVRTTYRQIALVGGTVYPSPTEAPIPNGVVLIDAGKVASVGIRSSVRLPPGIDIVDCSGLTITAGFWNSHVHFLERKWADAATLPASELVRQLEVHETALGQLRAWLGVDGVVLFGTDVCYMTDYDPAEEYVLMAESGMSFRQILASLTTSPAERFGASKQLGRIATGFAADLTVLKGDPSKDVRALTAVHATIRDGEFIDRASR